MTDHAIPSPLGRVSRAFRERAAFVAAAFRHGFPFLRSLVGLVSLVAGTTALALLAFIAEEPVLAAVIVAAMLALTFGEGSFRLRRGVAKELAVRDAQLEAYGAGAPSLSFGRAVLPTGSQPIGVDNPDLGGITQDTGRGRIIRVPVINARGAGVAKQVHARLTFLPDDVHRTFAPRDPAQGEWYGEQGPEIEIDLPGNGRPRMVDVLFVRDGEYPHAYEWTIHSRSAGLRGYAIKANPVTIDVEVMAAVPDRIPRTSRIALKYGWTAAT